MIYDDWFVPESILQFPVLNYIWNASKDKVSSVYTMYVVGGLLTWDHPYRRKEKKN